MTQVRERLQGATKAVSELGEAAQLNIVEPRDLTIGAGREVGEWFLALPLKDRPSAIFAASDVVAIGLLQVLIRGGVQVPKDVSIVGYDDIEFARYLVVPLTSVRQPAYEMGRASAELLITHFAGEPIEQPHIVFEPELIVRESSGRRS